MIKMKLLFSILFICLKTNSFSQKSSYSFSGSFKTLAPETISTDVLNVHYKMIAKSPSIFYLRSLAIYTYSSTIFDETKIILIDSSKFFLYHFDRLQKFCSAGYYKQEHSIFSFSSNEDVLDSIKRNVDESSISFPFADFKPNFFAVRKMN